ncbi:MAG TPA: hypothetical protein VF950_29295 [Planctomycetota bacterium]
MLFALASVLAAFPTAQDREIKEILVTLGEAMAAGNKEKISELFAFSRMIKEIEAKSAVNLFSDAAARAKAAGRLHAAVHGFAAGTAAVGMPWKTVRPLSVRVAGADAEALCRVLIGDEKGRFRFWLTRDGDAWKVYDFEYLEGGMRVSILLASQLATTLASDDEGRRFQKGLLHLRDAMLQLVAGETEAAVAHIAKARAAKFTGELGAWVELMDATARLAEGESEEALASADKALGIHKELALAHGIRASALSSLERYEESIAASKEFLRIVGDDAETWHSIGECWEELENVREALAAYRKGAGADDEEHENRLALGRLLCDDGKAADAAPLLLAAAKNAPADEGVFEEAAELLWDAGLSREVLDMALAHAPRAPEDGSPLLWQGRALRKLGRFDESERALRKAMALSEEDTEVLAELARAMAQAGKDAAALDVAATLAKLDSSEGCFVRAFIHAVGGRAEKAVEELRAGLKEDPDRADEVEKESVYTAILATEVGKTALAAARAKIAYRTSAEDLWEAGDMAGLLKLALERAAAAPDDLDARFDQGNALRRLGRAVEAEIPLRAVLKEKWYSRRALCRDSLGRALAAQGKVEEALEQAAALLKEDIEELGLTLRAAAYALAKKPDEALKALRELFKARPDAVSRVEDDDAFESLRELPAYIKILKEARESE